MVPGAASNGCNQVIDIAVIFFVRFLQIPSKVPTNVMTASEFSHRASHRRLKATSRSSVLSELSASPIRCNVPSMS